MFQDAGYSYTRHMIYGRRVALSTPLALVAWLVLAVPVVAGAAARGSAEAAVFAAATLILWATGLRSAAVWLRATARMPRPQVPSIVDPAAPPLRVALLFCVCDDTDLSALAASMRQDMPVETVILDDSRDPDERRRVDAFAQAHGCRVIRRTDRTGYKAGNLTHGVAVLRGRVDAYLVCDSDVVLPPHLARVCAAAFDDPTVAVAQASPGAGAGRSRFARYFGPLLATHLDVTRRGRGAQGVTVFLGRGALVRATAIDDVGGFPAAVAEDLAMTAALRRRGWRLVDVDAEFTEDYPLDYRAFRTQLRKTAEGAVEFLRRPARLRGVPAREALDLVVETALLPLGALAGAAALVSGAALAAAGTPPPLWTVVVSGASALVPLLPEALRRAREQRAAAGIAFAVIAGALYSSTMFVVLIAVLGGMAGRRAVFWITPKRPRRLGIRERLELLRPEAVLVPLLMLAAVLVARAPMAAAAVLGPGLLALAFSAPLLARPRHARPPVSAREPRLDGS
jgi:cellulose synthase/poly-beta-1,6-N-acetylglucosamine synthase-like glycosyltransferase